MNLEWSDDSRYGAFSASFVDSALQYESYICPCWLNAIFCYSINPYFTECAEQQRLSVFQSAETVSQFKHCFELCLLVRAISTKTSIICNQLIHQ